MNHRLSPRRRAPRGLTLLEMTVVLAVLIALLAVLYVGARSWKDGADRTGCIMTIRQAQVAMRSLQNIHGYAPGSELAADAGSASISQKLFDMAFISEPLFFRIKGQETCAGGGTYACPDDQHFPQPDVSFINCSLASSEDHIPTDTIGW